MVMSNLQRYYYTLCMIQSELDINVYNLKKCLFSIVVSLQYVTWVFQLKEKMHNYQYLTLLNLKKRQYLPQISDKGLTYRCG